MLHNLINIIALIVLVFSTLLVAHGYVHYNKIDNDNYEEEMSELLVKQSHHRQPPLSAVSNIGASITNPPMKKGNRLPPKELTIEFEAFEQMFYIAIERQSRLISADSTIIVHTKKKREKSEDQRREEIEGVPYSGRVIRVIPKPLAAATKNAVEQVDQRPLARFHVKLLPDGHTVEITGGFMFNGVFFKVHQQHTPFPLKTAETDLSKGRMRMIRQQRPVLIISRDSNKGNREEKKYKCGSKRDPNADNIKVSHKAEDLLAAALMANSTRQMLASKRDTLGGCPLSRKILYISVVADCGYVEKMGGDIRAIQANIISDFNMVSAIYEKSFNIELGLLAIHIMEECTTNDSEEYSWNRPCSQTKTMDERLNAFSRWRGKQSQDAGIFHLVTGCLTKEVVGIAWLNQVCNTRSISGQKGTQEADDGNIVSGTSISALIRNQFAVIAHEIGHNLGAIHDCTADVCVSCAPGKQCSKCCECGNSCDCEGRFVMSPESGGMNVSGFSDCSKNDICRKMTVLGSCLKDPGTFKTIGKGQCGDGIRDEGEECDCGGEEGCRGNKCCTPDCKLRTGAACDDQTDKCCRSCQLIPGSEKKQCSMKTGFCSQLAVCNGKSRDCPKVKNLPDGTKCGPNGNQCASGQCTTRDEQCRAVGQRLGLTKACPATASSCRMICSGEDSRNALFATCTVIDADFIDGTRCGFKGLCYKGQCSEGQVIGLLHQYWWLWIIVACIIGFIIILYGTRWALAYYRRLRHRPTIVLQ